MTIPPGNHAWGGTSDRARLRGDYVEYWSQIVNLFLELLQGVEERPGVVVIGATNHPDMIDAAVKRAGRLDREIAIRKPDVKTLARIFRHHLGDQLPDADLMPAALAARSATGADVEAYMRRARGAARRGRRPLALDDLLAEVRSNTEPSSQEERRRLAIHEAGHAVAATLLGGMEVVGVSIGDREGLTEIVRTDHATSPEEFDRVITMLMAGRAAEELVLGSPSAGAGGMPGSDLSLATDFARKIETKFGFGEYGPIFLPDGVQDPLTVVPGLLAAVKTRLDCALSNARRLLEENRASLDAVAQALERSGYLSAAEIAGFVVTGNDSKGQGRARHRVAASTRRSRRNRASPDPAGSHRVGSVDG